MQAVALTLRPPDGAFPGLDSALAAEPDVDRDVLLSLDWFDDGSLSLLYRLDAPDEHTLEAVFDSHEDVRRYEVLSVDGRPRYAYVHLDHSELVGQLVDIVQEYALILDRPIRFTDGGVVITLAGDVTNATEAFERVREVIDLTVEWTGTYEPEASTPLSRLTIRQREALEAAVELGFYESPRAASYEELGEALDCAPSTANALLRRSEAALVTAVLES